MKRVIFGISLFLAACSGSDMALLAGGPMRQLEYMQGSGVFQQGSDGKQRFVYSVPTDDVAPGFPSTKATREAALGVWLGSQKACEKGFVVEKRQIMGSPLAHELMEGRCR